MHHVAGGNIIADQDTGSAQSHVLQARALDSEELARGLAGSRPARMGSTGASSAASPHAPAAALSPAAQLQADAWWAGERLIYLYLDNVCL